MLNILKNVNKMTFVTIFYNVCNDYVKSKGYV